MNIIRNSKLLLFIVLFFTLITPVFSDTLKDPYEGEGPFVQIPAVIGMVIGGVSGVLAGGSLGMLSDPFRRIFKGDDTDDIPYAFLGLAIGGYAGGWIGGAPFYPIKKVCYDFPKNIVTKLRIDIKNEQ